ncbi:lytic transglycosylase domain-containing protein [Helicobacter sp. 23-1044]
MLFCNAINALTLSEIESKEKGVARDFYLYLYLQENSNLDAESMLKIYHLIDNKIPKIMQLLKIPKDSLPKDAQCKAKSLKDLQKSDDECFNFGVKLDYATQLSAKDLARITNPKMKNRIEILREKSGILDLILTLDGAEFSAIFSAVSKKNAIFNVAPKNPQNLSNKNFAQTIYNIVISKKYPNFTNALLGAKIEGVNDWTFYALGLNELTNGGSAKKALAYFENAANSASFKLMKDKSLFWCYKIAESLEDSAKKDSIKKDSTTQISPKKDDFLAQLAQSSHFNLYSLYAVKKLGTKPKFHIIDETNEIFKNIAPPKQNFDISDPFAWQKLRSEIIATKDKDALIKLAKSLYFKDNMPHLVFALNRYFDFKKSFFVKPYKGDLKFDDENLVFAVARQESAFLPSVISRSYALGMMQIMPFNVESFAKALGTENITYESMFNPQIALKFGDYYLAHLKKEFAHPLFVSYAYNGGPTFIRNFLKDAKNFSAKNAFEPWISMEFIPFEESRFYACSVMANYIIYREIDGENVDMDAFFRETLR